MSFARDAESSASACLSIWKVEPRAFRGGRGRRGRDWKGGWRVATSPREIFVLQLRLGRVEKMRRTLYFTCPYANATTGL